MSFFDNGPLPNWKEIQNWLGREIPWELVEKWDKKDDDAWLDRFIRNFMAPAESQTPEKMPAEKPVVQGDARKTVPSEISRSSKHVTVAFKLPNETDLKPVRLYATADRLRLTGLPGGRSETVLMPCRVYAKSGRAEWKQGRLVIRFRRRRTEKNEVELFIQA
ncbi:hypothetical protein [Cohnella nanjingensis]|uniref:Hsp20/alpha crystallin family protein n=1 Tax=Cohnella nanjingensis TaxID=1387779 RepID=A0A7X0VGS4_9BACL|nr:hypothetical protein [Cohnella nanjingensis]MBB6673405.1 hypothetical protein [Cohnella nanjingensis]